MTLGADAPTIQEGAGAVDSDSLAAQSSTFVESNRGGAPGSQATATQGHHAVPGSGEGQIPHQVQPQSHSGRTTGQTSTAVSNSGNIQNQSSHVGSTPSSEANSGALENQASYAGTAPSYVNHQYQTDEGGPKGKNLKEGGFEGEGPGDSIRAEPGSEMDPGRGAEQRFGITAHAEGAKKLSGNERYGALDNETSA